ncbi:hypothetical protein BV25DRAFT_1921646 [Artomyces pyxidatus]|uniref:Uncharacterized protein n=1 Tax=Artomyces pyxidatus TaxID=48021 RepID=A0ACB8SHB3_9AGAM|nr:hypothetical protein BV25DRAFT_1921646 [Artomyces pyxidatus]
MASETTFFHDYLPELVGSSTPIAVGAVGSTIWYYIRSRLPSHQIGRANDHYEATIYVMEKFGNKFQERDKDYAKSVIMDAKTAREAADCTHGLWERSRKARHYKRVAKDAFVVKASIRAREAAYLDQVTAEIQQAGIPVTNPFTDSHAAMESMASLTDTIAMELFHSTTDSSAVAVVSVTSDNQETSSAYFSFDSTTEAVTPTALAPPADIAGESIPSLDLSTSATEGAPTQTAPNLPPQGPAPDSGPL